MTPKAHDRDQSAICWDTGVRGIESAPYQEGAQLPSQNPPLTQALAASCTGAGTPVESLCVCEVAEEKGHCSAGFRGRLSAWPVRRHERLHVRAEAPHRLWTAGASSLVLQTWNFFLAP